MFIRITVFFFQIDMQYSLRSKALSDHYKPSVAEVERENPNGVQQQKL